MNAQANKLQAGRQPAASSPKKGGFYWWLLWIAMAIGTFIFSAVVWTWVITNFAGEIRGTPLTILWTSAVFGSWLVTMIPIIRAKERYWNRLSQEDEGNVVWWIGWIALTILTFFASVGFWTYFYSKSGGNIRDPGAAVRWVFSVFGTWLLALLPLMVIMYQKVDRAYEKARLRREAGEPALPKPKTIFVDQAKRLLAPSLTEKLKRLPATLKKGSHSGHLVAAVLKDGRRFENIFVANRTEVLGIYGHERLPFEIQDIADLEPVQQFPAFTEENWLRLDGKN